MVKCDECKEEMTLVESYKRGRRNWDAYLCTNCGFTKKVKGSLIPNKIPSGTMFKGCSVPWGKDKNK